jgi:hypothetical protein
MHAQARTRIFARFSLAPLLWMSTMQPQIALLTMEA